MKVLSLLLALALTVAGATGCAIEGVTMTFADQHDGDQKQITEKDGVITITPYANNETWTTSAILADDCTASIDFNVDGKPSPPPINLTASLFNLDNSATHGDPLAAVVFYDLTGALADPGFPLNTWVQFYDSRAES